MVTIILEIFAVLHADDDSEKAVAVYLHSIP